MIWPTLCTYSTHMDISVGSRKATWPYGLHLHTWPSPEAHHNFHHRNHAGYRHSAARQWVTNALAIVSKLRDMFIAAQFVPVHHGRLQSGWCVVLAVEFVLALTGSTMGSMICFIFPAIMYISVMSMSKSSGKSVAQVCFFLEFVLL